MDKILKNSKENLNKRFPDVVRFRRRRKEIIDEIVRIFQNVESFIKIQIIIENGRWHYTRIFKINMIIVRPTMRYNGWSINLFIFNFMTIFIQPSFQPSSCLASIAKITRRTWNKIGATPILNMNRIFRRGKFYFVNRSKRDFETKTWKEFRDFERDLRTERENYRIQSSFRMTDRVFRLLE